MNRNQEEDTYEKVSAHTGTISKNEPCYGNDFNSFQHCLHSSGSNRNCEISKRQGSGSANSLLRHINDYLWNLYAQEQ